MPTALWIVIGVIILAALCGSKGKNSKSAGSDEQPFRTDHPHIVSEDESECAVCGKRFSEKRSVCPFCGTRFAGSREDYEEFDEEEDEMEDWDEEEGL